MRSLTLTGTLCLAVLLASTAPAAAQRKPDATKEKLKAAKQHYEAGRTAYNVENYELAITEFKQAYEMSGKPGLLFNIAQSLRLKGDCQQALRYYNTFIREAPESAERPEAEARLKELDGCPAPVPEKQPTTEPAQTTPTPTPEPTPRETDVPHPGRTLKIVGLATAGAGLITLGLAIKFGLDARSAANDLSGNTTGWTAVDMLKAADGEAADRNMKICLAATVALGVTGGILYYLGAKQASRAETHVAPEVSSTGAGLVVWGRF